jgi:hypothetical protein
LYGGYIVTFTKVLKIYHRIRDKGKIVSAGYRGGRVGGKGGGGGRGRNDPSIVFTYE